MPVWTNSDLLAFHGTDDASASALVRGSANGGSAVSLASCKRLTDFGRGFYVTTRLHQAKQWANMRVLRAPPRPGMHAVVIGFRLPRGWLASLEALEFVRPTRDFWNLVTDCRHGFLPHQRGGSKSEYDMVCGPVTLWPQTLVIANCDQISFHSSAAVAGLPRPTTVATAPQDLFR